MNGLNFGPYSSLVIVNANDTPAPRNAPILFDCDDSVCRSGDKRVESEVFKDIYVG